MKINLVKLAFRATLILIVSFLSAHVSAESYEDYLNRVEREINKKGMNIDPFGKNPFQTGTALKQYFLMEKSLLLERDAFLSMKANKLRTSEDVADFHHRMKVLRSHSNNMLFQLRTFAASIPETSPNQYATACRLSLYSCANSDRL